MGGLGGSLRPILFGYLLEWTGIWTTSWRFLFVISVACLVWMHTVVRRMVNVRATDVPGQLEERGSVVLEQDLGSVPQEHAIPRIDSRSSTLTTRGRAPGAVKKWTSPPRVFLGGS